MYGCIEGDHIVIHIILRFVKMWRGTRMMI
jgi:hypothetical protein